VPTATSQGAYTAAQAGRGRQLYRANCSSCHAATAYTGATFRQLYVGRTAYDLVSLIRETMPNDDPGKLSAQQYVNIVAYLFQLNGYPPGTRALSVEDAALKRIAIDQAPEKSN
jgi:mono/diheme cytochrome c family protein